MTYADLERMVDAISDAKPDESAIARIADLLRVQAISREEARKMVERIRIIAINRTASHPPILVEFDEDGTARRPDGGPIIGVEDSRDISELREALRETFDTIPAIDMFPPGRITSGKPLITEIIDRMAEDGYDADVLIHGEPEHVIRVPAGERLERGDLVELDEGGVARRADGGPPIGVALGDGLLRLGGAVRNAWDRFDYHQVGSIVARPYASMAYHASIAYPMRDLYAPGARTRDEPRYQYNERFPKEVVDKAMQLLAKFMSADQYKAFMEGSLIELQNKAEDHRIMLNRNGRFSILKGPRGAGITMTSGNIGSYKYPIGDEIAVFLDWFNHRTLELIDRWKCGTYTIKDGELR